ncbi:hypothetical protein [Fusobacterium ulcerans]|uniref:hypothetical protein n=1 Tax=Fusobacterium ulcerans TaxID=861 RepID=UPI002E77E4B6|nr:hypothetical protein [Fusobacterium ulcerans]MEE0138340.1 hypothetical protein [Fusobacterium ulcerans]
MKTNVWYPAIAGGQQIAVKFDVLTDVINTVRVSVSVPCRKGQYVILQGVDNDRFTFYYNKGKCVISWIQDTSNIDILEYLFEDIRIWFRYNYAIRMDEGLYTSMELLRVF